MYKSQITKIANILAINYQRIQSYGLVNGYLGIVLFYCHYSRYISYDVYEKMANDLLYSVISQKNKKMPRTFSDGLYGLGWSIKYMIREKFLDVDNDTLKMFDTMAFSKYSEIEFQHDQKNNCPLFSKGLYTSLLCNNELKKQTFLSTKYILDNINVMEVKMSFLISILYFLYHCNINGKEKKMMVSMRTKLLSLIQKNIEYNNYQKSDLFILELLLKKIGENIDLPDYNLNIISDVYMNWQTIIYEDAVHILDSVDVISLDEKIGEFDQKTPTNQLSLDGLCSLGINLIRLSEDNNKSAKSRL